MIIRDHDDPCLGAGGWPLRAASPDERAHVVDYLKSAPGAATSGGSAPADLSDTQTTFGPPAAGGGSFEEA